MNCCVRPAATDGATGASAIETSVGAAAVTVSAAVPDTPLMLAVIVVVPTAEVVAKPPGEVIVAVPVLDEVQVAIAVISWLVLLL